MWFSVSAASLIPSHTNPQCSWGNQEYQVHICSWVRTSLGFLLFQVIELHSCKMRWEVLMNVSPSSPHWGWWGFRMQRGVWVSQKTNLSFLLLHSDPVDPVPSTASECFSFMFCLHAEAGTTGAAGVCFPASTESSLLGSLSPEVIPGYELLHQLWRSEMLSEPFVFSF